MKVRIFLILCLVLLVFGGRSGRKKHLAAYYATLRATIEASTSDEMKRINDLIDIYKVANARNDSGECYPSFIKASELRQVATDIIGDIDGVKNQLVQRGGGLTDYDVNKCFDDRIARRYFVADGLGEVLEEKFRQAFARLNKLAGAPDSSKISMQRISCFPHFSKIQFLKF